MHNHLIFNIISSLPKKEVQLLKAYVKSIHAPKCKSEILLNYIINVKKETRNVSMLDLFKKVYKTEEYKDNKIRVLISQLMHDVEDFLVFRSIKKDKNAYHLRLLDVYRELEIDRAFQTQSRKLSKTLVESRQYGIRQHLVQYQFSKQNYWHHISSRRQAESDIKDMVQSFELYQIIESLKLLCYAISAQVTYVESKFLVANVIMDKVQNGKFLKDSLVKAYYLVYMGFSELNDTEHYYVLQTLIRGNETVFSKKDMRTLTLLVINYCIRRYNNGDVDFLVEMFNNYKQGLLNGSLYSERGLLSRWTYQNIVSVGLILNEITWTEEFLLHYKDKINSSNKSEIYVYNLSKLFYKRREFKKAILHLQSFDSKDIVEVLNAKALLLRIYYEESEWDALDSLLGSFEKYITRNKRLGYQKKAFLNLVRYTNRLVRLQTANKKQLITFKTRIEKEQNIADKHWLIQQIEELEGR